MGFGILPGCSCLHISFFQNGNAGKVFTAIDILDSMCKASGKLRDIRTSSRLQMGPPSQTWIFRSHCARRTYDCCRDSTIIRLLLPGELYHSLLAQREGYIVFYHQLKEYSEGHRNHENLRQASWVLEHYDILEMHFDEWRNEGRLIDRANNRSLEFLKESHRSWNKVSLTLLVVFGYHYLRKTVPRSPLYMIVDTGRLPNKRRKVAAGIR